MVACGFCTFLFVFEPSDESASQEKQYNSTGRGDAKIASSGVEPIYEAREQRTERWWKMLKGENTFRS